MDKIPELDQYSSPAYFLADCHLPLIPNPKHADWEQRILRFLRTEVRPAATLFLVGDIFDFWFEWRHAVPAGAFPVLATLSDLVQQGTVVHYLAGNHDGHPGDFLRDQVGLRVTRGAVQAEIDGRKFYLNHGDGVAKQDRGYRMLRSLVRWGPTEKIYRLIHPDLGIALAKHLSKASRAHLSGEDKFGLEPYQEFAFQKIDQGFDYVIMGHRHKAGRYAHQDGVFLAIGDWIRSGSYGKFENGELSLNFFT